MNKKKLIALLLALGMIASMHGCSSSEDPAPKDEQKPGQSDDAQDKEETPKDEQPEEKKEEKKEEVAHEITYSNVKVYNNSIGTTYAQTIVEIENTGSENLYLSVSNYDLEDASGKLIASSDGLSPYPEVIAPGEKGYFIEEMMLDNAVEGEITLLPRLDVEKAKVDNIRYAVSDVEISTDSLGYLKALGRVENTTDEDEDSMIYVVVILKDANGAPIGKLMDILTEDLKAGDKIGVELSGLALPKDITPDSVASFEAFAYPMQMQF